VQWPSLELVLTRSLLRIVNSYGLFRVMTKSDRDHHRGATMRRMEAYEFGNRANSLGGGLRRAAPAAARWQMWFAALAMCGKSVVLVRA
jgi:hypothetical protein